MKPHGILTGRSRIQRWEIGTLVWESRSSRLLNCVLFLEMFAISKRELVGMGFWMERVFSESQIMADFWARFLHWWDGGTVLPSCLGGPTHAGGPVPLSILQIHLFVWKTSRQLLRGFAFRMAYIGVKMSSQKVLFFFLKWFLNVVSCNPPKNGKMIDEHFFFNWVGQTTN